MSTALKDRTDREGSSSRSGKRNQKNDEEQQPQRPNLADRAATWEPDHRWFVPFIAAQVLYVGSCVVYFMSLPTVVAAIVAGLLGVGITVATTIAARQAYDHAQFGDKHEHQVVRLSIFAGLAGSGWMALAAPQSPLNPVSLGLLVLWIAVFGALWGSLHTLADERKQKQADHVASKREEVEERKQERAINRKTEEFQPILTKAGLGEVTAYAWEETKAGDLFYLMDSQDKPQKFKGIEDQLGSLASIYAHELAAQGVKLTPDMLRLEEGEAAHLFKLHISTKNRFRESIPYPLDKPQQSISQPINPGVYEDGEDVLVTMLGAHMYMVGATGSGKDVFTNCCHAEIGNTNDCLLWIGGTAKMVPQAWPWIAPWIKGLTQRPMVDRVAGEDPQQVLRMMADLYKIGTLRNKKLGPKSKHRPTPQDPAYFMTLTESSDLLRDHPDETITTFDGRRWTASKLADVLMRAFRSASVMLYLSSQYGLMDGNGNYGSYIMRNVTIRVAGKTMTHSDGQNTLVGIKNVDTTKLTNYKLMLQPNQEEPRAMPTKAYELDGEEQIQPLAVRNAQQNPARSPQWVVDALGDEYRYRWSASRNEDLVDMAHEAGLSWPTNPNTETESESSETVEPEPTDASGSDGDAETTEGADMPRMSEQEINQMLEHAESKFAEANEHLKKYGILGETMHNVYEVVMAENAPEWVSAGQLAFVCDRVDEGGDWDTAGQQLADEMARGPWYLKTETRNGQIGWPRDLIRHTVQAWVEGGEPPAQVPQQDRSEPVAVPEHPLAHAAQVVADRGAEDMVSTAELAKLMGRVTDELDESEARNRAARLGRELGQFVTAKRVAAGSRYRVGDIREAAHSIV